MDPSRAVAGSWGAIAALVVVAICTWTDLRDRRIPNVVTLPAAACGVLLAGIVGGPGAAWLSFLGLCLGLAAFLIPCAAGGMGCGDVKLMACVGALLGFPHIWYVVLYTALAGGAIALVVVVRQHLLAQAFRNMGQVVAGAGWGVALRLLGHRSGGHDAGAAHHSVGKIPYATAIAVGTAAYLMLGRIG